MDKTTVIGIVLGFIAILAGMLAKGTSLVVLLNPAALFIIFLGTAAAILIGFPGDEVKRVPKLFKILFKNEKQPSIVELIRLFVKLSSTARKEGLLAIEQELDTIEEPFLKQGLRLVVDGLEPDFIKDTLEADLAEMEDRHLSGALIFTQAGTYAPTLGVLGAVLGLIAALGNLNDMDALGHAIAAAFVATLFGIFTGYVLWHPFANKLKRKSKRELMIKAMMIEGVLAIQSGVAPRAIVEKLIVFAPKSERNSINDLLNEGE